MVNFMTKWVNFHKIFKIFVVINQKIRDICGQKLVWVVSTMGTKNTPTFVKIQDMTQNSLYRMTHWRKEYSTKENKAKLS